MSCRSRGRFVLGAFISGTFCPVGCFVLWCLFSVKPIIACSMWNHLANNIPCDTYLCNNCFFSTLGCCKQKTRINVSFLIHPEKHVFWMEGFLKKKTVIYSRIFCYRNALINEQELSWISLQDVQYCNCYFNTETLCTADSIRRNSTYSTEQWTYVRFISDLRRQNWEMPLLAIRREFWILVKQEEQLHNSSRTETLKCSSLWAAAVSNCS